MQKDTHTINTCLSAEKRFWCWPRLGVAACLVSGVAGVGFFNMWVGAISSVIGFGVGKLLSAALNRGGLQSWLYWNAPLLLLFKGKRLADSKQRRFL